MVMSLKVKYALLILFLLAPLCLATEQVSDVVEYKGKVYQLVRYVENEHEKRYFWIFPLEEYVNPDGVKLDGNNISLIYPELKMRDTACYRGYIGLYSLKDHNFYLNKLIARTDYNERISQVKKDKMSYQDFYAFAPSVPLERVNPQWKSPVLANWFSGKIYLADVDVALRHSRLVENPQYEVEIKNGEVVSITERE